MAPRQPSGSDGSDRRNKKRLRRTISLFEAVGKKDRALAQRLLAAGRERLAAAQLLRPIEMNGGGILDLSELESLLRNGGDPNALNFHGLRTNPLAFFLMRGDERSACLLIEYGADVGHLDTVDAGFKSQALHIAVEQGLDDIVWLLLIDGADPNQLRGDWSALFLSTRLESPQIAKMLIEAGANVNLGLVTETPLMAAAENGSTAIVDLLIAHHADVNAQSRSGWTALHHAAWSIHPEIAQKLLDAGADRLARDAAGLNATDHATQRFDPVYAEFFRQRGIPDEYSLEDTDDRWQPASDYDYFVSYRQGRFLQEATSLAAAICSAGLRPFLDIEVLKVSAYSPVPRSIIKSRLKKALERSRITIFFETYLDGHTSWAKQFSWQFFELIHSRQALLISLERGTVRKWIINPGNRVSTSDTFYQFSDIDDLAAMLVSLSRCDFELPI